MRKYVIITDSGSDLKKELREKYDIDYVPMRYSYDGKDAEVDLDWKDLSASDFYDIMRNGTRIYTSAVNVDTYKKAFEKYLALGFDILSISTTAALSNSYNASCLARENLIETYPEAKIICVDPCISCAGLGLVCIKAAKLRAEGKTIEETRDWILENKKFINQEAAADKLIWLKLAGRVSAASAFFGGLLSVKPLVISDIHGNNLAIEKVKGRKASIKRIAERVADEYIPNDLGIHINHADCLEDALRLKDEIMQRIPSLKDEDFEMGYIGATIGASVGPGMIGVYFYGKEVTADATKK